MGETSCGFPIAHPFPNPTNSPPKKMGDGGAEHGDPHNHRGGGGHHFPVGSLIEVQDNVEEGVYFSATVLSSPTSRRRSSSRNSDKLRVKYHDLVACEDRPDRLTESVDVSYVRPAPPSPLVADKPFEPNDVVDAFYKDGWWKGVVSRVVEGGERFEVTFENPPDVREFGPSSLRAHWDWIDGVWIGLQKQSEAAFEVGEKVEASLERDEDLIGAWIPATIVEVSGNGAYFVELKDKNGGWVKAEVDLTHLRPSPPVFQQGIFGTSERVEAFFNSGWRNGVITKEAQKNRYGVFLEHMQLDRVFDRSEVRARMDWKDGKWFVGSSLTSFSETSPSTKRRKVGGDNHRTSRNGKFEKEKIEKIVAQDEDPNMGEENVSVQADEGRNEDANQGTKQMAIEKLVAQDEDQMMGVENVLVRADEEQIRGSSLTSSAVIDEGDDMLPDSGWPFAKRNVKPHFQPLRDHKETAREGLAIGYMRDHKETAREGLAIGYMVTFSNVVDRSCSLNIDSPKCDVDDINEALIELEAHGFDVGTVRNHVMKVLAEKDKEEKLVHEMKDIKNQIEDHRETKSRIEKEITVIQDHLRRLQEQLRRLKFDKANELRQLAHLKAALDQNQQQIDILRSGFEAATASIPSSR